MKPLPLYKVLCSIVILTITTTTLLLPVSLRRKIHNKTNKPIYVGMYHYYKAKADRKDKPVRIEPGTSQIIKTRGESITKWRVMVFDYSPRKFEKVLSKSKYDSLPNKLVGMPGSYFIAVSTRKDELKAYNYLEWKGRMLGKTVKPIIREAAKIIKEELGPVKTNPYKNIQAKVRVGNRLPPAEKAYLAKRKPKVKIALEKFIGRTLDGKYVPKIAFICSGGGYRSMICTTGSLTGADKIGLLGGVAYITALSGSVWAVGPWITLGKPIQEFRDRLVKTVTKGIRKFTKEDLVPIIEVLLAKVAYSQPIGLVDLYGALLSNRLLSELGPNRQMAYLSQQAERIKNGDWPFPIYTAVRASKEDYKRPPWFEFTPYEIGSSEYGAYVPTWAYGRKFENGQSLDDAPEQTLGFYLGTWGSVFAFHVQVAWDEVVSKIANPILRSIIDSIVQQQIELIAGKRFTAAEVFNFMKGMPRQPLSGFNRLKSADAGLAFSLPYPPVSGERPGRRADILIFLDASDSTMGDELKKIEVYARSKGLKFPTIDYTNIGKKAVSIFKDENDPSVPVVVYMPCINDVELWNKNKNQSAYRAYRAIDGFNVDQCIKKGFCGTMNFEYTPAQSTQLMLLTEFNMVASKKALIKVINWVIDQKSK